MLSRRDALFLGCASAAASLLASPALASVSKRKRIMGYNWELLMSSNANIPAADGVACCVHPNGNRFMFGGIYTSTMSGLYRSHESDPAIWTFLGNLSVPPRHLANLVLHSDGRIYIRGGDHFNASSQRDLWSFDGSGGDLQIEDADCAPGPRIGVLNFSFGDYIYELGGQSAISQSPVTFYTDFWRWSRSGGWEVLREDDTWGSGGTPKEIPCGTRGFYSGIAQDGAKVFLVGGTEYEAGGFPRDLKHDVWTIEIDAGGLPIFKLVNARLPFSGRTWPTLAYWKNNIWCMLGHDPLLGSGANGDLKAVWRSPDGGETWIQEPDFPGTKRHAAGSLVGADYIDIGTGSHYGKDFYRLYNDTFNYGTTPSGTTGWGGTLTIVDGTIVIPPNTTISTMGISFANSHANTCYQVVRHHSNDTFDEMWSSGDFTHNGGGYHQVSVGYTTPNDGAVYRLAARATITAPDTFANGSHSRWQKPGSLSGSGVALSAQADGTICMRWAEQ